MSNFGSNRPQNNLNTPTKIDSSAISRYSYSPTPGRTSESRRTTRQSVVKDVRYGEPRIISQTKQDQRGQKLPDAPPEFNERVENPVFVQRYVDKPVEVVVERPFPVERVVEIPFEVVVERPVEIRQERDVYIETIIERPVERTIEQEVEYVYEHPVEVVVEQPIYVERVVENPIRVQKEQFIEKTVTKQVPVNKYIDKEVLRTLIQPVERQVSSQQPMVKKVPVMRPREVTTEVPVYYDREVEVPVVVEYDEIITKVVPKPMGRDIVVEKQVERPYERVVEVPIDVVIERPYEVIKEVPRNRSQVREVEKVVQVPRDVYVDKPVYIDKVEEIPVDKRVPSLKVAKYSTNAVEKYVEKVVDRYVDVPQVVDRVVEIREDVYVDKVIEKDLQVTFEVERRIPRYIEEIVEKYVEVPVVKEVPIPIDVVVEKQVFRDRVVEVPVEVEKIIEVPRQKYIDKIIEVEKIVEKPIYIERRVEKPMERIVEKIVEVPIEKFVEVPYEKVIDKVVDVDIIIEKPVYYEKEVRATTPKKRTIRDSSRNESLRNSYRKSVDRTNQLNAENARLKAEIEFARSRANSRSPVASRYENASQTKEYNRDQYEHLKKRFNDLRGRMENIVTERNRSNSINQATRSQVAQQGQPGQPVVASREKTSTTPEFTYTQQREPQFRNSDVYSRNTSYNVGPNSGYDYNRINSQQPSSNARPYK